jgi:hypothetical protein
MRPVLAILALALWGAPAVGKLEISNVTAAHGKLGPERKSHEYYPNDEVCFRYLVTGANVDDVGKVECSLRVQLAGTDGKPIEDQSFAAQGILALGGSSFPASASLVLPNQLAAGEYTFAVTFKDKLAEIKEESEASFTRTIKVLPTEFAIIAPRFSYDRAGKIDAPPTGAVDQTLFFRLKAIGFDRSRNRIDTEMNVRVLDEKGKDVTTNPIRIKLGVDDPSVVKDALCLDFRSELFLNRPGDFTLSVAVIDWVSKKTVKFETPLKITVP